MSNKPAITNADLLPSAPAGSLRGLLQSAVVQNQFKTVLGKNSGAFIASLAVLVYNSDHLKDCHPPSVVSAALKAAALNLLIDPSLGQAYIVPFNDKSSGKKLATFQIGWRGLVQLALRTGQYKTINVAAVNEGVIRGSHPITGELEYGAATSDKTAGYVAYLELVNGFSRAEYMTREEVDAHAKKFSKTYGKATSTWTTNFEAMALKTVLRRLLTRFGLLSIEMQTALQQEPDESAPSGSTGPLTSAEAAQAEMSQHPDIEADVAQSEAGPDYTDPDVVTAQMAAEEQRAAQNQALWGPEA